LGRT
jgi:hypothetical protein